MKYLITSLMALSLSACGSETAPKTGAMPGVATGGYEAPSHSEAEAAYMAGFQARYDIPELDYPEDIKARIAKAKEKKFAKSMKVGKTRQRIINKLALAKVGKSNPEAKEMLEALQNNPKLVPSQAEATQLFALMGQTSNRKSLTKAERAEQYEEAIEAYEDNFRRLEVESCRWTEMKRLIGSGHEAMAFIHGVHPEKGYRCEFKLTTEKNKGYPRATLSKGFWVKLETGDWAYYGKFPGIKKRPRKQKLDEKLLKNPEKTIKRQSRMDYLSESFQ